MISLRDVLEGSGGILRGMAPRDLLVKHIRHDSREVQPGDLFVALVGERLDGHAFIGDAIARGAVAVMIDQKHVAELETLSVPAVVVDDTLAGLQRLASYWRNLFDLHVVGITGSVGKTSTKEAVAAVLSQRYHVVKSRGSYNNEIGVPLTLLSITPDTDVAVVEIGGAYRMGEVREMCALACPDIGIVTNVSHSHLARMGSLEAIAKNKAELVESLPDHGVAVLNGDDFRVRAMAARSSCRVVLYGLAPDCTVRAENVASYGLQGIAFDLVVGGVRNHVRLPLIGRHSVHTALAALAVGYELGMTLDEMLPGFSDPNVQVRLLTVPGINGATILDDSYNANPTSCLAALSLLAEVPAQRRIAVFGDMFELGSYEEEGHRLVGRRAAHVVDLLFTLGPRARLIAEAALDAGLSPFAVIATEDRRELIDQLRELLRPGDFVLVKGAHGMRMDEIVEALRVQQPAGSAQ